MRIAESLPVHRRKSAEGWVKRKTPTARAAAHSCRYRGRQRRDGGAQPGPPADPRLPPQLRLDQVDAGLRTMGSSIGRSMNVIAEREAVASIIDWAISRTV